MSKLCELTGKKPQFGNNVSHSQRKTRRKFLPNIQILSFFSDAMKRSFRLKVTASATKLVEKKGGLDCYLLSTKNCQLAKRAMYIKSIVQKKLAVTKG